MTPDKWHCDVCGDKSDFFLSPPQLKQLQDAEIDPTIPRELRRSHLTLLDELGKGNFGVVYKGLLKEEPRRPGYLVAVKTSNDSGKDDLLEEAAIMAQV